MVGGNRSHINTNNKLLPTGIRGRSRPHKRLGGWTQGVNAGTVREPEEEGDRDTSSGREREQNITANWMEKGRGEQWSSEAQLESEAEGVPWHTGSGEEKADANTWYDANWDTTPEMLVHPATA
ncbi:hypothetical protein NDU88_009317 [Pleurodeles waltl]|uniref:Uncharacterized protein n=1 Tax=Pleurodeles waltl TaxID=8319 RepID=A0AAV7PRV7_PLEWA|nr:hypothetical protein NDU88_009317 [Pleurodeles waltl]